MVGALFAAGDSIPSTDVYGVLVALIGMAGVLGSALIIQIFSTKRALTPSSTPPPEYDPADDVASLYEHIGRLKAQLEACEERKTRATPKRRTNRDL